MTVNNVEAILRDF